MSETERMENLKEEMKKVAKEIRAKMLRNESTIILRAKFKRLQKEHQKLWMKNYPSIL